METSLSREAVRSVLTWHSQIMHPSHLSYSYEMCCKSHNQVEEKKKDQIEETKTRLAQGYVFFEAYYHFS